VECCERCVVWGVGHLEGTGISKASAGYQLVTHGTGYFAVDAHVGNVDHKARH